MRYLNLSFIILGILYSLTGKAQTISGPTSVDFNAVEVYSNSETGIPGLSEYYWKIFEGTEQSGSTETQVTVKWDQPCTGRVEKWIRVPSYSVDELFASMEITINNIPVINYSFDASGNRTDRNVIYLNSSTIKKSAGGTRKQDSEIEKYSDEIGDLKVSIFPNPTQSEISIDFENFSSETDYKISIYNLNGALIKTISDIQPTNTINLSDQSIGVYIITISNGQNVSKWRIIKE